MKTTPTLFDIDDMGYHILESQYPLGKFSAPKDRVEIALDPKILESYVGEYELAPTFKIKVTHEGARLFAQATGQPQFEIFAEKEGEFLYKVVDAQITFSKDSLILHQGGADQKAKKIQ